MSVLKYRGVVIDPDRKPLPDKFGTHQVAAFPSCSSNHLSVLMEWVVRIMRKVGPRATVEVYETRELLLDRVAKQLDGKKEFLLVTQNSNVKIPENVIEGEEVL
jgi:hypothetical protein